MNNFFVRDGFSDLPTFSLLPSKFRSALPEYSLSSLVGGCRSDNWATETVDGNWLVKDWNDLQKV